MEPTEKNASSTTVPASLGRMPTWVMPLIRVSVFAVDAVLAAACFIAAFKIREGTDVLEQTSWAWSKAFVPYAGILFFCVAVRLAMLIYQRAYDLAGAFEYSREAGRIFKATIVSSLLIVAWAFLFRGGFSFRDFSYSRGLFVIDFALALAAFTIFHLAIRFVQAKFRERDINLIPTVIVGENAEARATITELNGRKYLGYRVIGVVGSDASDGLRLDDGTAAPILGPIDELADIIRRYEIQEVIITDNTIESERLFDAMMALGRRRKVEFRFAPSLFDLLPQKTSVDQIGVLPMLRLFRDPLSSGQRFIKRLSDSIIALVAGLVTAPVWLIAALAVKLDSKGNVIFKQERVGMDGRVFLCYKFRTMVSGADESVHRDAYEKNIGGEATANTGEKGNPVFGKVKDDVRITRVGGILRRTSIDELPQLINVLRGEMSIVGPRPPIPYEVAKYEPWHRKRLDMKPGLTGLWQVSGRSRLTFEEMVRVDLYYIENWSLLLDAKIIFLTIPAVFGGDGAR